MQCSARFRSVRLRLESGAMRMSECLEWVWAHVCILTPKSCDLDRLWLHAKFGWLRCCCLAAGEGVWFGGGRKGCQFCGSLRPGCARCNGVWLSGVFPLHKMTRRQRTACSPCGILHFSGGTFPVILPHSSYNACLLRGRGRGGMLTWRVCV